MEIYLINLITMVQLIHSPRLKTVLMVEKTLEDAGEMITLAELKRRLPRKVMHGTLIQILDYLQQSGKILIGARGIVYTYAPREEIERKIARGLEV